MVGVEGSAEMLPMCKMLRVNSQILEVSRPVWQTFIEVSRS
jgi:hypothetical protein